MAYSNSSLVNYTKLSPFYNTKTGANKKITIHHMGGNLSVETCGNVFQSSQSSANYGIGSDGRVGMYVEEKNRSWASSSPSNDYQAVTIEVANDQCGGDWHVSDKAYSKLIDLCVDICRRNGISKLNYTGDASGNLTMHCMFVATICPGPYLKSKMQDIAKKVNDRLSGGGSKPTTNGKVNYQVHAQSKGWFSWVCDGATAGTTGESRRLEAIKVALGGGVSGGVQYNAHVQDKGWMGWVSNGNVAGTTGQSKRMEAIQIKLTGDAANKYDIYYKAHCQTYGWLDWAKNGEIAGTTGLKKRMEAIQIVLVPKGGKAPGATTKPNVIKK